MAPKTASSDILVLGTRGVGKTTFMTVLGHVFERSGIFGLGLTAVPGTDTFRYVGEMWHRMTAPLEEREFPPATDPHSPAAFLAWDVGLGTRQLFRLSTLDCAGETVYRVFGDAPGDGEQEAEADLAQASQLREMADRARVLCLFVRPADLDAGHSKHAHASAEQRRQSRETVETLLAVSNGAAGEGKQLLFVLSDSAGWEAEFERKGGPKAWLFDEVPQLARSARAQAAVVLGVSAVCETLEKQGHTNDGTPFSLMVPADNFHSEGLETFILCVGSLATRELNPLGTSLLALQETQLAYSEACQVSSPSRCSDRMDAAKDFAAAAEKFAATATAFLSANHPGALLRQNTEQFIAQCTLPAQRALALERGICDALAALAEKQAPTPVDWSSFRTSLLAAINAAPPGGMPYAEASLPEADSWYEAFLAAERAKAGKAKSRRRRIRFVVASAMVAACTALAGWWGMNRWKEIEELRYTWPGPGVSTHPHVRTLATYDDGWEAMPGWELPDRHRPASVRWVKNWSPAPDAPVRSGEKEGTWICPPGYSLKSASPKSLADLEVVWVPNRPHPSVPHIHSSPTEGQWEADEGYEPIDGANPLGGVRWHAGRRDARYPGVQTAATEGEWAADPGYVLQDSGRPETAKWSPGAPHPVWAHVIALTNKGAFGPETGYTWGDDKGGKNGKWKVQWLPDASKNGSYWLVPHAKTGRKEGSWIPDPGYILSNPKDPYSAIWKGNQRHPAVPHAYSDAAREGKWLADDGYELDDSSKPTTARWKAGKRHPIHKHAQTAKTPGQWEAADPGYVLGNKSDPASVKWSPGWQDSRTWPHVTAGQAAGSWICEPGWTRLHPHLPESPDVKWTPGMEHPNHPNVVACGMDSVGNFIPAPGYVWATASTNSADLWKAGVRWKGNLRNSDVPHIYSDGDKTNSWIADPGYKFRKQGDAFAGVVWDPGQRCGNARAGKNEGSWIPDEGYVLKNPADPYSAVRQEGSVKINGKSGKAGKTSTFNASGFYCNRSDYTFELGFDCLAAAALAESGDIRISVVYSDGTREWTMCRQELEHLRQGYEYRDKKYNLPAISDPPTGSYQAFFVVEEYGHDGKWHEALRLKASQTQSWINQKQWKEIENSTKQFLDAMQELLRQNEQRDRTPPGYR